MGGIKPARSLVSASDGPCPGAVCPLFSGADTGASLKGVACNLYADANTDASRSSASMDDDCSVSMRLLGSRDSVSMRYGGKRELVGDISGRAAGGDVGELNVERFKPAPEMDGARPPVDGTWGEVRLNSLYTGLVTAR